MGTPDAIGGLWPVSFIVTNGKASRLEQRAFYVEFVLIQDRFVNIEFTLILHQKMQIDSIKECVC